MATQRKIALIGLGAVGSTIAYTLQIQALATELLFIDANEEKALGETLDLNHSLMFTPQCTIRTANYSELSDVDLIIITAGANRKEGQDRTDLLRINKGILSSIITNIKEHTSEAMLLLVANPVDTLTHFALELSGYPSERVIGTGTNLDTARFRSILATTFSVAPQHISANILGNHGNHAVPVWSNATIAGEPLEKISPLSPAEKKTIEEQVKKSGMEVISRKMVTNYGIAASVASITRSLMNNESTVQIVSSELNGFLGFEGIALSLPTILNRNGIQKVIHPTLSPKEEDQFKAAAKAEQEIITQVA